VLTQFTSQHANDNARKKTPLKKIVYMQTTIPSSHPHPAAFAEVCCQSISFLSAALSMT